MMPEGPEVRTLVDQLQGGVGRRLVDIQFVSGRYVRNAKPKGFKQFASTMTPLSSSGTTGSAKEATHPPVDTVWSWKAKGKFIYIILDDGVKGNPEGIDDSDFQRSIWITLGMTGKFVSEKVHAQSDMHGRWYLELLDLSTQKKHKIHYHDRRNFGTVKFSLSQAELQTKLDSLGPDMLETTTSEEQFLEIISKKKPSLNICKFLMNQANICGIGNYILAEGLYRSGLDPFASLEEISETQQRYLFRELKSVAQESYEAQGMTRRKGGAYSTVDGSGGRFEMQLQCYGRDFCPRGYPVIQETAGPHGRTIWYTENQLFMPLRDRFPHDVPLSSNQEPKRQKTTSRTTTEPKTKTDTGWNYLATTTESKAKVLLSTLTEPDWKRVLSKEVAKDNTFSLLSDFLAAEASSGQIIYPPHEDVFSALNLCPLKKVKVVIVGQDPYHSPGQGNGLAFSVRRNIPPPPSLKNIFKEAIEDVGIEPPSHGSLEHWTHQGVLLLNTVLTVQKGNANSHKGKGWEQFTDCIIKHLDEEKEGLVFLLFGNPAHKKASSVDSSRHTLIRTSHPSPLGATKTSSPFLESKCFSRCNKILEKQGQDPIDWSVP